MAVQDIFVPDIGNFDSVDVIEVLVKAGDVIAKDDSLITVESDKASMDIPAPFAGVVQEVKIKVGDKAAQGTLLITLDVSDAAPVVEAKPVATPVVRKTQKMAAIEDANGQRLPRKQVRFPAQLAGSKSRLLAQLQEQSHSKIEGHIP